MASSSIPGFFQPRPYNGNYYMDGGTVYNIDATDAIKGCLNQGYDESDIVVDIAICGQIPIKPESKVTKNAFDNAFRGWKLRRHSIGTNEYLESMRAYPKADWRHFFVEWHPMYPDAVDFRNSTTWKLQTDGREQAKEVL